MRATDLGFRSPKEKTAEFSNPLVTFDGRSLPIVHNAKNTSFSKARRFSQYDSEARKTGERAGPGSYNLIQHPGAEWRIKGTPLYKSLHQNRDTSNNGFFFFGHSMVYEPSFVLKSKNRRQSLNASLKEEQISVSVKQSDPSAESGETKRTSTAGISKRSLNQSSNQFQNSPYLQIPFKQVLKDKSKTSRLT